MCSFSLLIKGFVAVLLGSVIAQAQMWRADGRSVDWPAKVGSAAVEKRQTNGNRIAR